MSDSETQIKDSERVNLAKAQEAVYSPFGDYVFCTFQSWVPIRIIWII